MSRYQLKLLVPSVLAVGLILIATFGLAWFEIDFAGNKVTIDMRSARACGLECVQIPIGRFKGMYPSLAGLAFWCSIPLVLIVAIQTGSRLVTSVAYQALAKIGYGLGSPLFPPSFAAGYLFAPEGASVAGFDVVTVERTLAPLLLVIGSVVAMVVLRYALLDEASDDVGEYKPISIAKRDARNPPTPSSINKPALASTSSLTLSPSAPPLETSVRPHAPPPAPEDQIPVAPESGLTIRMRTPSAGPMAVKSSPPAIGGLLHTSAASTSPVATPVADHPQATLHGRISYAVTTAAFSGQGIVAHREDGVARLVAWDEVVGIVARRLPQTPPYDGAPFVDVVSFSGATLRLLPWTEITGHSLEGDAVERARSVVQLLAAQCLGSKLDGATTRFSTGTDKPSQLADETALAAHDQRLA